MTNDWHQLPQPSGSYQRHLPGATLVQSTPAEQTQMIRACWRRFPLAWSSRFGTTGFNPCLEHASAHPLMVAGLVPSRLGGAGAMLGATLSLSNRRGARLGGNA